MQLNLMQLSLDFDEESMCNCKMHRMHNKPQGENGNVVIQQACGWLGYS
jgi:hypothetical protein